MLRRSRWLPLALVLLASLPSTATVQKGGVEGVDVPDVVVKPVKAVKAGIDAVDMADVIVKNVQFKKIPVGAVMADGLDVADPRVEKIIFEGLGEVEKKLPPNDEDIANNAAAAAEQHQGAPDPDESGQQTAHRAMNEASTAATQAALSQGDSPQQAQQVALEAQKKVREDYAHGKADAGSAGAPAAASSTPSTPSAEPAGEALPEVLEPPPKETAEGSEGEAGKEAPGTPDPAVIDVPQEQQ